MVFLLGQAIAPVALPIPHLNPHLLLPWKWPIELIANFQV